MNILIAALLIVALLAFLAAWLRKAPEEPSPVRLIALGLALQALALLLYLDPFTKLR